MSVPQHLSNSEHYITPKFVIDAYKEVLGENIALDPATSIYNNSLYIKAPTIYTEETNGLEQSWNAANVFLNFPSSKTLNKEYKSKHKKSCSNVWFEKFAYEFNYFNFDNGLIVLFNSNHLNTLNFKLIKDGYILVCPIKKRINYEKFNDEGTLIKNKNPTHNSSIVFVTREITKKEKFIDRFDIYGDVWEKINRYKYISPF